MNLLTDPVLQGRFFVLWGNEGICEFFGGEKSVFKEREVGENGVVIRFVRSGIDDNDVDCREFD